MVRANLNLKNCFSSKCCVDVQTAEEEDEVDGGGIVLEKVDCKLESSTEQ